MTPFTTTFANTSARGEGLFISLGGNYWVATLTDTYTTPNDRAQGITVDSSGNVYVCGYAYISSGQTVQSISKYNTSGTIQWQRTLTDSYFTHQDAAYGIAVDNSGNVYVCGYGTNSSGTAVQSISKWNNSGTIQWQNTLTDAYSSPYDIAQGITVDSSGNVYVCGFGTNSLGNYVQSISKWNNSGTIQWQNTLTDSYTTPSDSAQGITVDSSGNVYVCGYGNNSLGYTVQSISKWNTSGTIQWQRTLTDTYTTPDDIAQGIAVDSSGNVYVCGYGSNSSGKTVQFIAKLPSDGSKTGTYSGTNFGVTYAASTWTAATSSWTSATSTWTAATSSWTSASSSWTSATSTWTTDKALIP